MKCQWFKLVAGAVTPSVAWAFAWAFAWALAWALAWAPALPAAEQVKTAPGGAGAAGEKAAAGQKPTAPEAGKGQREGAAKEAIRTLEFHASRDPFKSLEPKAPKGPDIIEAGPEKRPAGIRGMQISDVKLIGLAKGLSGERIVIVNGTDQKAHFLKAGDRLWDGFLKSIEETAVLFVRETKFSSGVRRQDVKMHLYPPIQQ